MTINPLSGYEKAFNADHNPSVVPMMLCVPVIDSVGRYIGNIERLVRDKKTNRISSLVLTQGVLLATSKAVPVSWVKTVEVDRVQLNVEVNQVNLLPPFRDPAQVDEPYQSEAGVPYC